MSQARRIIVCLDGTWETPQEKTNIYKFYNNINKTSTTQWEYKVVYYPGLGTTGNCNLAWLGGAFGYGISNQIISAYSYICTHYRNPDDQIWLLGFSRGAFAARSLSGLIYNVGLLPPTQLNHVNEAYNLYRDRCEATRFGGAKAMEFREKYGCQMPLVNFLGCFDTVGALGVPKLPWYLGGFIWYSLFFGLHGFHDTKLTPIVTHAFHAISIHDQREWFRPTLMHFAGNTPHQQLSQVWFPGMHGDVGGQETQAYNNLISCHSFNWMMTKAASLGLPFLQAEQDCAETSKFIYRDTYLNSIVYRLMPRKDREIEPDENTGLYMEEQLYNQTFLTKQELDLYLSKTVEMFHLKKQEQSI